jgi:hypothetical protein
MGLDIVSIPLGPVKVASVLTLSRLSSVNVVANWTEPLWLAITGSEKEDVRISELLLAAYTYIVPVQKIKKELLIALSPKVRMPSILQYTINRLLLIIKQTKIALNMKKFSERI